MSLQRVTVFGGTGFLGRRIVRHLHDAGFAVRIASRHPDRGRLLFSGDVCGIESVRADVNDEASVATVVRDAWAVVNAVSFYVEHGKRTFQSVHVDAAGRVAMLARQTGVENFAHISGIGSDAGSASPYIRSRGKGEAAVLEGFPTAALIRPAVIFGAGDAFLTPLLTMLRDMPVFPMFGRGETRLQPAYVKDVAEAIARVLRAPAARHPYELAGPHVYTYQALLRTIAATAGKRPFLLPFPFRLWHVIGYLAEILPSPPLTRNQVELMEKDNLPNPDAPGFEALGISPQAIEDILPQLMQRPKEAADP